MYIGSNITIEGDTFICSDLSDGCYDLKYDYKNNTDQMVHDGHYMWELVKSGVVDVSAFDIYNKDEKIFGKIISRLGEELVINPTPDNLKNLYNERVNNFSQELRQKGANINSTISMAMVNKQHIALRRG